MPVHRSPLSLLIVLLFLAQTTAAPARAQPTNPPDRLLTSALVGTPIAAGHYIFWKQRDAEQLAIHGYNLATSTRFVVAQPADALAAIASDGTAVVWTMVGPTDQGLSIQSYDLQTHAISTLTTGVEGASEIALDQGWLFYTDAALDHRGLFAREIASGHELLIGPAGRRPIAADGALLWSEEQASGVGQLSAWSLHLRTRDGRHGDTLLAAGAAGYGGFSGYDVSGGAAVWA